MSAYLDTRGNSILSVAVCDRCNRKFPYVELMPDPNFPGMRVCAEDKDNFDPWRLPARQTENIALRFPRPDVSVATGPIGGNQIQTQGQFGLDVNSIFIEGVPSYNTQGDLNTMSNVQPTPQTLNPYIYSVSPSSGPRAGMTPVTIIGANFTDVTTVKFKGQPSSFNIVNSTTITAVAPVSAVAGVVDITAISPFGSTTYHGGFTYT